MPAGRKPLVRPRIEWKNRIDAELAAEIELILADPLKGKAKYGSRSDLIEQLLRDWVEKQRKERG